MVDVIVTKTCKCGHEPVCIGKKHPIGVGCPHCGVQVIADLNETYEDAIIKWNKMQEVKE